MTEAQIQTLKLLIVEDRPQLLDELSVQLLYFQPPATYNPSPPYINLLLNSQNEDEQEEAR